MGVVSSMENKREATKKRFLKINNRDMKYLFISLIGFVMFTNCDGVKQEPVDAKKTETAQDNAKPEPSKEELEVSSTKLMAKIIDVSTLNLKKNGANKWGINEETFTKLMKIKKQIYVISGNMESYEVSSYNEMGKEFLDFIKTIPIEKDEAANIELQKVISATNEQCLHLVESNLQFAQIAIINLSNIYDAVPNYFEINK